MHVTSFLHIQSMYFSANPHTSSFPRRLNNSFRRALSNEFTSFMKRCDTVLGIRIEVSVTLLVINIAFLLLSLM